MDKNLLNDAVNSDERPTPGYMFAEIASKYKNIISFFYNFPNNLII
jgi:hypothetical protein